LEKLEKMEKRKKKYKKAWKTANNSWLKRPGKITYGKNRRYRMAWILMECNFVCVKK